MNPKKHITVIGGGIAGMEAAGILANLNYKVTIVEKQTISGGKLNDWNNLFPDFSSPEKIVSDLKNKITASGVDIIYNTEISHIEKHNSRFEISDKKNIKLYADAVVLASGFNLFDATLKEEYGYGVFQNVITSADLEKRLRNGLELLTSQGTPPKRLALIHCVGSRDAKSGNTYCSKVCCITGVKQAIELNKMLPACEIFCFYMDLRLYGSTFDSLYLTAQQEHKIQFIRGRLSEVSQKVDNFLQIKAEDTLSGKPLRLNVDMVVLLIGMEPCTLKEELTQQNDIQLDENGFFKTQNIHSQRNHTTNDGIFLAGSCICPMSVSETLENARSCALTVHNFLQTRV